ncbi:SPOSA6832_02856, partial [Sporobolomyces salmonicolor]
MSLAPSTSYEHRMNGSRSASPEQDELEPTDTLTALQDSKGSKGVTLANDAASDGAGSGAYPPARPSRQGTREMSIDLPPLRQRLTDLFEPERPIKKEPTWKESGIAIVKATWLNLLLVFIPVGWAMHFSNQNDTIVFIFTRVYFIYLLIFLNHLADPRNFKQLPRQGFARLRKRANALAPIIPLAKLLGFGTEELALRVGQTLGGRTSLLTRIPALLDRILITSTWPLVLNATLGNAVELIVAIIALAKCEIQVVQSSLLGSILSNLLLVLGMCFFAGGIKFSEQGFKDTAAQLNSSLLVMSVIAILLPAGYNAAFADNQSAELERDRILKMSRGIAVILLVVYLAYLIFQLFTHQHLYADARTAEEEAHIREGRQVWKSHRAFKQAKSVRGARQVEEAVDEEEEEELPTLNKWAALVLLAVVTVMTAEFLVDSINGLTDAHPEISVEWVGLILLPIVGNAAEHVTAVSVSVHDKIDLSMGVAVGSSIQIALFVIPFCVILGWIMDKPLSLLFDPFESIVLFLSVLITNYTIQDGRSNWLEGFLLMMVYIILAVSFWYYPASGSEAFTC